MNLNPSLVRRAAVVVATCFVLAVTSHVRATSVNAGQRDFAGAFIVEHVGTLDLQTMTMRVNVVGGGCVTDASKAYCDNHNTQVSSLIDNSGSATYTIFAPGGSVALQLTILPAKSGGDPVNGIWFGGTFTIVPDSGTGCYKNSVGGGTWTGGAEFSGPVVPGVNPPGTGRWTFWGTIARAK